MAATRLDFYFDFSSPYGYLAANEVEAVAGRHGLEVAWRPFLLGAVFKQTGGQPLMEIPLKGDYARRDMERSAREQDIPFVFPPSFPFASVAACRAVHWLQNGDATRAGDLVKALYAKAFGEGGDISTTDGVLAVAERSGIDRDALAAALNDPAVKQRTKDEVEAALAKGVFGSPYFIVEGEPFWGHDRLPMLERWLTRGGW